MSNKNLKKIGDILSVVCIVMLLIALLFGSSFIRIGAQNLVAVDNVKIDLETFGKNAVKTEGTVLSTDYQTTHISYDVEGEKITMDLQVYSEEYVPGSKLDVYYSNDDSTAIRVPDIFISYYKKTGWTMMRIGFIIFGTCAFVGGGCLVAIKVIKKKIKNEYIY